MYPDGSRLEAFKWRFKSAAERRAWPPPAPALWCGMVVAPDPARMLDQPLPDLELRDSHGKPVRLRARVGHGPLVVFFIIHAATPG